MNIRTADANSAQSSHHKRLPPMPLSRPRMRDQNRSDIETTVMITITIVKARNAATRALPYPGERGTESDVLDMTAAGWRINVLQ